jgi:hypothetical protein
VLYFSPQAEHGTHEWADAVLSQMDFDHIPSWSRLSAGRILEHSLGRRLWPKVRWLRSVSEKWWDITEIGRCGDTEGVKGGKSMRKNEGMGIADVEGSYDHVLTVGG